VLVLSLGSGGGCQCGGVTVTVTAAALFSFSTLVLILLVVAIVVQPRVVASSRKVVKEEGLVDVSFGLGPSGGIIIIIVISIGGKGPISDRHAMVRKACSAHVDTVWGNVGSTSASTSASTSISSGGGITITIASSWAVVVGIVSVIDGGSGPVGGRGRLGLVPVAQNVIIAAKVAVGFVFVVAIAVVASITSIAIAAIIVLAQLELDIVENALEPALFQDACDSVVEGDAPEVGASSNLFPFRRSIVFGALLVEIAGNENRNICVVVVVVVVGLVLLFQKSSNLVPPSLRVKGVEVGPDHPAAAAATFDQDAEGRPVVGKNHLFGGENLFAGGNHGGCVPVARHARIMVSPQPQDFF